MVIVLLSVSSGLQYWQGAIPATAAAGPFLNTRCPDSTTTYTVSLEGAPEQWTVVDPDAVTVLLPCRCVSVTLTPADE
jgi:hypothetical protein